MPADDFPGGHQRDGGGEPGQGRGEPQRGHAGQPHPRGEAEQAPVGARRPVGRGHTVTRDSSSRNVASPIPGTSWSSSTVRKPPCWSRYSTIRWASTGPTPGSDSSSAVVAVLRFSGPAGPLDALGTPT